MIRLITFGALKIWLFVEQLHSYHKDDIKNLTESSEFICYFKFSEPTVIAFGELIRDADQHPVVFKTMEEAERFATDYLEKRFYFKKHA